MFIPDKNRFDISVVYLSIFLWLLSGAAHAESIKNFSDDFRLSQSTCNNVVTGGGVVGDEILCTPDIDPAIIQSSGLPTGGFGAIEYLWLSTTIYSNDLNSWTIIPGANGASYDPPPIYQTTYFIRCARRSGCTEFVGETNIVTKEYRTGIFLDLQMDEPVTCEGNGGAINLTTFGETLGLTYAWSNGSNNQNQSNLSAGSYTVTVTNYQGCSATETISLEAPGGLSCGANITSNYGGLHISAFDENDGSISVLATGQNGPFSYQWSNGLTGSEAYNLTAGFYQITITDNSGCNCVANTLLQNPAKVEGRLWHDRNGNGLREAGEEGIPYQAITLSGLSDDGNVVNRNLYSDPNGFYRIDDLPAGDYSCTYTFPETYVFTIANNGNENIDSDIENGQSQILNLDYGTCISNLDAGMYRPINIGNFVWEDYNINGQQDFGEPGIPEIPIQLIDSGVDGLAATSDDVVIATLETGSDGDYVFEGVAPGTYFLSFEQPDDFKFTLFQNGANYLDSDVDPNTGRTAIFTVSSLDPDDFNLDAGLYTCRADTNGGIIGQNQIFCEGTVGDADIYNNEFPSGGQGELIYTWYQSFENIPFDINNPAWTVIAGATASSYEAISITQNTYFIRCARRSNCEYAIKSNIIQYEFVANPVAVLETAVEPSCFAGNDGALLLQNNNGELSFEWNNGQSGAMLENVTAGTYQVTVTNTLQCTGTASFTLEEPILLELDAEATDPLCFGSEDGSITLQATGGTLPYTYQWSNGLTTATADNLAAGGYAITLFDNNNCETSVFVTLNTPVALSVAFEAESVSCYNGTDGTLTAIPAGGTPPYTYSWGNGASENILSNQAAGTYMVTITDNHDCQIAGTYTIGEATVITVDVTTTNTDCIGGADGTALLSVSGGAPGYTLLWNTGATGYYNANLAAGSYTVTVSDLNNCTNITTFEIAEPEAIDAEFTVSNVSCANGNDGNIIAIATGGTAPYNYTWNTGQTMANVSNLAAGNYTVTITDFNNCIHIETMEITAPAIIASQFIIGNVSCANGNDGNVTAMPTGGTPPYHYNWNNGQTTANIQNLTAGNYIVTITDSQNCQHTESVNIPDGNSLNVVVSGIAPSCATANNGGVNSTVNGGTAPYTYSWSNGSSAANLQNVGAGYYAVTVTDANGCAGIAETTLTEGAALAVELQGTGSSCFAATDASIFTTIINGVTPYTYSWSNGSTDANLQNVEAGFYAVTVTDANGCVGIANTTVTEGAGLAVQLQNTASSCSGASDAAIFTTIINGTAPYIYSWSNGSADANLQNVEAGSYAVTVTDANGCSAMANTTVTEGSALEVELQNTELTCFDGDDASIFTTINNGTAPYSYSWSNGETTQNISNLSFGEYIVTVADANGCSAVESITIADGEFIILQFTNTNVACALDETGTATVTPLNGEPPFSYVWSNGMTGDTAENLSAGNYAVTVTDNAGCTIVGFVNIQGNSEILIELATTDVLCAGGQEGSATASVSGGMLPYTYAWSNGATGSNLLDLEAGSYNVTVTDSNGCIAIHDFVINDATGLIVEVTTESASCNGGNDGSATAIVSGGTAPYTYAWSNGDVGSTVAGLPAGMYTLTVTDVQNCNTMLSFSIGEGGSIDVSFEVNQPDCHDSDNGSINVVATGGLPPYNYMWDTGATNANINNLADGVYTITIVDANNCSYVDMVEIVSPAELLANVETVAVSCADSNDGGATATISGGTPPYEILWTDGTTSFDNNQLSAGVHGFAVSDANGCVLFTNIEVPAPDVLQVDIERILVDCDNNLYNLTAVVAGGTPDYQYEWNTGSTSSTINETGPGEYSVTITDANNCVETASIVFFAPVSILLELEAINPSCNGGANGAGTVAISGGVAPYEITWSNGDNDDEINNLLPGMYSVSVVDAQGCSGYGELLVEEPTMLELATNIIVSTCNSDGLGMAEAVCSGGLPPYNYLWSDGQTTAIAQDLPAGVHNVTITDQGACEITGAVAFEEGLQISIMANTTDVDCEGYTTGSIIGVVEAGVPPLSYAWNTGDTTSSIFSLVEGIYSLTVTDGNSCTGFASINIDDPTPFDVEIIDTDLNCYNGEDASVTAIPSEGVEPYTFLWNTGAETATIENVGLGFYVVTITDANGCPVIAGTAIGNVVPVQLSLEASSVSCNGLTDAGVSSSIVGGVPPYTYEWNTTAISESLDNIAAGAYSLTITDNNGCTDTASVQVMQPDSLLANGVYEPLCFWSGCFCNGECLGRDRAIYFPLE